MVKTSRLTVLDFDDPARLLLRKLWIVSWALAAVSSLPLTWSERRTPRRAKSRAVGLLEMGTVEVAADCADAVAEACAAAFLLAFSFADPTWPMAWRC